MVHVVIPARNEAERIPDLIAALRAGSGPALRLLVVDNASSDSTADAARRAGADEVIKEPRVGKGYAVTTGLRSSPADVVFLCDADVRGLSADHVQAATTALVARGAPLARLALSRPAVDAPVTSLVARPLLRNLSGVDVAEPLGGLAAIDRRFVLAKHLPGGWGFDVALTIAAIEAGHVPPELPAPEVTHRRKPLGEYLPMADAVTSAILRAHELATWDHDDCVRCAYGRDDVVTVEPIPRETDYASNRR